MKALCPRGNVNFLHLPFFFSFISLCRSFIFGRWLLFMRSREFRNGRLKIKIFSSVDISMKIENSKFKRFYDGMHELKTGCRKTRNCSEIVVGILDFCLADSRSLSGVCGILHFIFGFDCVCNSRTFTQNRSTLSCLIRGAISFIWNIWFCSILLCIYFRKA